jgi:hypothetical protein
VEAKEARLGKHFRMAMSTHTTIGQLLDTVSSLWSMPRLYDDQWDKSVSCVMSQSCQLQSVVSHEHGSRGVKYSVCSERKVSD